MALGGTVKFQARLNKKLKRVFEKRTLWLRTCVSKAKPGRPPIFDKDVRERAVEHIRKIASKALASRLSREEFRKLGVRWKTWTAKGKGEQRKKIFSSWARERLPRHDGKVYVIFGRSRCLYVGRTVGSGKRASKRLPKPGFQRATKVRIYYIPKRKAVPLLECLAIHRFRPKYNKIRAAREAWARKCPLCAVRKDIGSEMRTIFRLR